VSGQRRAGIAALGLGLLLVLGARLVPGLGGPPLYDGVVTAGPYLWLSPGPGQQGNPQGAAATVSVGSGGNDIVALATPETVPQAQILAVPGSLTLPSGAASLSVSIKPVPAPGQPADGTLASNVYDFTVADQRGATATAKASARVSIVLRSADATLLTGVVERWDGSHWVPLKTAPPGVGGAYLVVVTEFGDYAVVMPSAAGSSATAGASGAVPAPTAPEAAGSAAGTAGSSSAAVSAAGEPTPGASVPASDAGSGSMVLPIVGAGAIVLVVLLLMLLLGRRSGTPPPAPSERGPGRRRPPGSRPPYRGAHRIERDDR
jgi:hypothetical protein